MSEAIKNKSKIDKNTSFEDAMAELENIVRQLEGGKVKLEDAVELYETGSALKKHCDVKLKEAKLKVQKVSVDSNGEVVASKMD
jgi:exodeoxyribonuclease VII small subunit